jgi:hypothetical protein
MYSLFANDDDILYGVQKFVLDTVEDIESLPKTVKAGSSALIIASSELYVMNHSKEWVKMTSNGNGEDIKAFLEWERF